MLGFFRRWHIGVIGRFWSSFWIHKPVHELLRSTATFLTVLTPLVVVPLTVITFYLRSLREHQITRHAELVRRVESIEAACSDFRRLVSDFERDYTTKEEWLRECMHARSKLEQLAEASVRIETLQQSSWACPAYAPPTTAGLSQPAGPQGNVPQRQGRERGPLNTEEVGD